MSEFLVVYLFLGLISAIPATIWGFEDTARKVKNIVLRFMFWWGAWPLLVALCVRSILVSWKYRFRCPWCGSKVDIRDDEVMQEHVRNCKEHPLLNRIAELEALLLAKEKIDDFFITLTKGKVD